MISHFAVTCSLILHSHTCVVVFQYCSTKLLLSNMWWWSDRQIGAWWCFINELLSHRCLCFLKHHWYSKKLLCARKLSVSQSALSSWSPCCYVGGGGCLAGVGGAGWGQERTKEQKLHYKETIQAIKLYNQSTTMRDFGPHVASLRHKGPQTVWRMWQRFGVIARVRAFGVVLCPAAAQQYVCWIQSGQVRKREGDREKT